MVLFQLELCLSWNPGGKQVALPSYSSRFQGVILSAGYCLGGCSPHVCLGFLRVLWIPPIVQKHV